MKIRKKLIAASLTTLAAFGGTALAQGAPQPQQPQQPQQPTEQQPAQKQPEQQPRGDQPQPPPQQQPAAGDQECPEFLKGAKMSVKNVGQGVQFTIRAGQSGYVEPLRNTTREIADFVEQHERTDTNASGADATQTFPPVEITVKDVKNGVVVMVKAEKTADLKEIRTQANALERAFRGSNCINGAQKP